MLLVQGPNIKNLWNQKSSEVRSRKRANYYSRQYGNASMHTMANVSLSQAVMHRDKTFSVAVCSSIVLWEPTLR